MDIEKKFHHTVTFLFNHLVEIDPLSLSGPNNFRVRGKTKEGNVVVAVLTDHPTKQPPYDGVRFVQISNGEEWRTLLEHVEIGLVTVAYYGNIAPAGWENAQQHLPQNKFYSLD